MHPEVFLPQEGEDIVKTGRWVTKKHENFFSLRRLTQYPLISLKRSVTFEKLNVRLQKGIMGHSLRGIYYAGYFLQRLN